MMMLRLLVLVLIADLSTAATSTIYRETRYEATNITDDDVTVDVQSEIPGKLTWIYTNENTLTILIIIRGRSITEVNKTNVYFNANTSSITLTIDEWRQQNVAAVTGTGSKNSHMVMLLLFAAVLFNWKRTHFILLIFVANGISQGFANKQPLIGKTRDTFIDIEIRAPRRFHYKDVNLFVNSGTVRVINHTTPVTNYPVCRTKRIAAGCDNCCYGNGLCIQNKCVCDDGFDPKHSCKTIKGRLLFYSHPIDPHLSRTILPNNDSLTLYNNEVNTRHSHLAVKRQGGFYIDFKLHNISNKASHQLVFNQNGFMKKYRLTMDDTLYSISLRRSKTHRCSVNVIIASERNGRIVQNVKICNDTEHNSLHEVEDRNRKSDRSRTHRRSRSNSSRNSLRKKKRLSINSLKGVQFIDIPVKVERCGVDFVSEVPVSFEMLPSYIATVHANKEQLNTLYERMTINSYWNDTINSMFLRLPDTNKLLTDRAKTLKCKHVVDTHVRICKSEYLQMYDKMCDKIQVKNSKDNDANMEMLTTTTETFCIDIMQKLNKFCDTYISQSFTADTNCYSHFTDSVNLFSNDVFTVRPKAQFTDGKEIIGRQRQMSLRNLTKLRETGIVIKDDKPVFKILKVTVIPTDPVPMDIYQVKLDYTCATNNTVIRMNVTGSDFYTNHVTCQGNSSCNCCILHAAGAANAVVDHVKIHVKDTVTNLEIAEEMVVIF